MIRIENPVIREPFNGGNGIVDTQELRGDDIRVVAYGARVEPGQVIISPGGNGRIDTIPAGDEVISGTSLLMDVQPGTLTGGYRNTREGLRNFSLSSKENTPSLFLRYDRPPDKTRLVTIDLTSSKPKIYGKPISSTLHAKALLRAVYTLTEPELPQWINYLLFQEGTSGDLYIENSGIHGNIHSNANIRGRVVGRYAKEASIRGDISAVGNIRLEGGYNHVGNRRERADTIRIPQVREPRIARPDLGGNLLTPETPNLNIDSPLPPEIPGINLDEYREMARTSGRYYPGDSVIPPGVIDRVHFVEGTAHLMPNATYTFRGEGRIVATNSICGWDISTLNGIGLPRDHHTLIGVRGISLTPHGGRPLTINGVNLLSTDGSINVRSRYTGGNVVVTNSVWRAGNSIATWHCGGGGDHAGRIGTSLLNTILHAKGNIHLSRIDPIDAGDPEQERSIRNTVIMAMGNVSINDVRPNTVIHCAIRSNGEISLSKERYREGLGSRFIGGAFGRSVSAQKFRLMEYQRDIIQRLFENL